MSMPDTDVHRTTEPVNMDPETLTALQGSIAKWQAIVDGTGFDQGTDNCPLCQRFNRSVNPAALRGCGGCPVAIASGEKLCGNTPYDLWTEAEEEGNEEAMAFHAKRELEFLTGLLPKVTT